MLKLIFKLLTALNSETDPAQISLGFCFGLILGFTPFLSMHNLVVLFLILVLRVNVSAAILAWGFFAGVAYVLDPLFIQIGEYLLALPSLPDTWTLPTVTDTGTSGCNFAYTGTDCGWNVDLSTGEMAHMFYSTLGNTGARDTAGNPTACSPSSCLTNAGPFSNLQSNGYWYSTPPSPNGWFFAFSGGNQNVNSTDRPFYAWAVSSGDPLATRVPGAVWLFAGALGALGWVKRRSAGERQ